jgi:hypothetical protein
MHPMALAHRVIGKIKRPRSGERTILAITCKPFTKILTALPAIYISCLASASSGAGLNGMLIRNVVPAVDDLSTVTSPP